MTKTRQLDTARDQRLDWRGCQGPHWASGLARVLLARLDLMHDGEDEARDVLSTLNPQQASGIHSPQQFVHLYVHMTNMLPLQCMHVTVRKCGCRWVMAINIATPPHRGMHPGVQQ